MLPKDHTGNARIEFMKKKPKKKKPTDSITDEFLRIDDSQQMAEAFRQVRRARGISMERLAGFADLSRYAVLYFENRQTDIRLSTLLKILKLCDIELYIRIKQR